MALPGYQFTVQDEAGNIIPGASVRVTLESDGSLSTLYTDPNGAVPAGNPVISDADGFVYFHVTPGVYKIRVTAAGYERTIRYVNLGTSVTDGVTPGIRLNYNSANHTDSDPGAGQFKTNNATFASITTLYIDNADVDANAITAILDTWDDNNNSSHRGVVEFRSTVTPNIFMTLVLTGSVVDGTGYRKLTVTPLANYGTLSGEFAVSFSRTGNNGSVTTTGTPVANNLVKYLDTSGVNIGDAGVAPSADGTFAANSDAVFPTQKAAKTYVDAKVAALADLVDLLQYKGVLDCSANPNYPAASAGHVYIVSVAGKVGGASGRSVEVGDMLLCRTDSTASGNEATVGAQWSTLQTNLLDTGNLAFLNVAQSWSRPQRYAATALTASTAWDGTSASRLTAAVSTAFQIANPSAATDGQFYHFEITYSGSGPVTWGTQFKGISAVTWTNTSGKKDRATFQWNAANSEMEYVGHSLDVRA